jgi:hypothetical protein
MKEARWDIEQEIMHENFPHLYPFLNEGKVGFQGYLTVKHRTYELVVEGSASHYPQEEPRVYLHPHPEEHHWIRNGSLPYLCYARQDGAWSPAHSTFASCVAVAIKYLEVFG